MFLEEDNFLIDNSVNKQYLKYNTNLLNGDIFALCYDKHKNVMYCGGNFTQTEFTKMGMELKIIIYN